MRIGMHDVNRVNNAFTPDWVLADISKESQASPTPQDVASIGGQNSPQERIEHITILHTNDLHGHVESFEDKNDKTQKIGGLANIAAVIEKERAKNPDGTLVLDAGDISSGTLVSDSFNAIPMLESMNAAGFDATVVGNHDIDKGLTGLGIITEKANFPVLCSNMVNKNPDKVGVDVKSSIIKTLKGVRIGIVGFTTPDAIGILSKEERELVDLAPVVDSAKKSLEELKKQNVDLIIGLDHIGLSEDESLAAKVPGFNIIVSGHSHEETEHYKRVGDTLIVQTGEFGKKMGRMDIEVLCGAGPARIIANNSYLIPIKEQNVKPDAAVSKIIDKYASQVSAMMGKKLGRTQADIFQEGYKKESNLGDFVTDTVRETVGSDIFFMNPGGLRADLPKGEITQGQMYQLYPWDDSVTIVDMKGKDIRPVFEEFVGNPNIDGLALSGAKIEVDESKPVGQRVDKLTLPSGDSLEEEKIYKVATSNFNVDGKMKLASMQKCEGKTETAISVRDSLINKIQQQKTIEAKTDSRMLFK